MIFQLFRRPRDDPSIASLYGTIVAQARKPAFYQSFDVPDTVNGRLEMILLHVVLLLRRLAATDRSGALGQAILGQATLGQATLGQAIFDLFCQDMDANLREMGVGDLSVPREMRRIGEAFYGRQAAYCAALDSKDPGMLDAALARNVLERSEGSDKLANYVRAAVRVLAAQDIGELCRGKLEFPDPAGIVADTETP
jgi:cytochrome b pre-mRNA-processing protein 3